MQEWVSKHGFSDGKALVDYAMALSTHYGEAIGALACNMYDATALAQKVIIPAAEPAATPTYGEVAKAIYGTLKESENKVPATVGRLVKQVGADTTLKNAKRDGAEFAWVPQGDTCAFCITLASRGYQHISKAALKNGHAEHIHANCDCQYSVRFDGKSGVKGYDPDKYLRMYNSADPDGTPQEKINALRRQNYLGKKENTAGELIRIPQFPASIISEKIKLGEYSLKLTMQQYNKHLEGTMDYERYKISRLNKGLSPQSKLILSYEESKQIIEKYSGRGIIRANTKGEPMHIEDIKCDKVIGYYMQKGEWIPTNKAALHHGKKGTHIVPQKGNNYD